MTAPSRTADEIIADWHAGRADHDPYDEIGGLAAEVRRLRTENERLERRGEADEKGLNRWCNYQDRLFAVMTSDEMDAFNERLTADGWWNEPLCRHEGELARTEGDLGVAIREAAAARADLAALGQPITEYGSPSMCFNGQETTNWGDRYWVGATLGRTVRRGPEWMVDHETESAQ